MDVLPRIAIALLPTMLICVSLQTAYRRHPDRHEIIFELYDFEWALYGPALWAASLLVG